MAYSKDETDKLANLIADMSLETVRLIASSGGETHEAERYLEANGVESDSVRAALLCVACHVAKLAEKGPSLDKDLILPWRGLCVLMGGVLSESRVRAMMADQ